MKIRFESTIDDLVAFNRFHCAHSPTWQWQIRRLTLLLPLIMLMIFFIIILAVSATDEPLDRTAWIGILCIAATFLTVSIGWGFFIRWYMYWSLVRNTRKLLAEGSNRILVGWREMTLADGRLIVDTELVTSSLDLRAVQKIVRNDEYTFVYISSTTAYMIPMNLYPEDEYRRFVARLREAWKDRGAPNARDAELPGPREVDERITRG